MKGAPAQLVLPVVTLLGLILAYFLGSSVANEEYFGLAIGTAGLLGVGWAVLGRSVWWLPMFFFPALGGMFYVGFKIHVHEIALLLSFAPLVLVLALNRSDIQVRKHGVQGIVLLLIIYLCLHLLVCLVYLKATGQIGFGNVLRRYTDAMWPIIFLVPFLFFGKTRFLNWAMHLMLGAVFLRVCVGIYTVYLGVEGTVDSMVFIPLINFLPAGANSGSDLRTSGPILVSLAIVYFCLHRGIIWRCVMLGLIALGCWGAFLGSSRLTLLSTLMLIAFPLVIYRKTFVLLFILSVGGIGMLVLNANPDILYSLPDTGRRAATALVVDRGLATDMAGTDLSDQWHYRLMDEGWKSWTENFQTIMVGRGTRAFEARAWDEGKNFEGMVEMAVVTSRFEKGLWDTLCTFGLIGFALFMGCMFLVITRCLKALMRDRISSYALGLAFIGAFQCLSWLLLCWIGGTFPSSSIMLGLVALIALDDERAAKAKRGQLKKGPDDPTVPLSSPTVPNASRLPHAGLPRRAAADLSPRTT